MPPTYVKPYLKRGKTDAAIAKAIRTGEKGIFAYSPVTAAFNATGQPAVSLPLCRGADGLPIGVHLATRFGADTALMSLCADRERARPWFDQIPHLPGVVR
ncbi:MAG: hypothetical protein ACE369_18920 [Roseovarius sp.]